MIDRLRRHLGRRRAPRPPVRLDEVVFVADGLDVRPFTSAEAAAAGSIEPIDALADYTEAWAADGRHLRFLPDPDHPMTRTTMGRVTLGPDPTRPADPAALRDLLQRCLIAMSGKRTGLTDAAIRQLSLEEAVATMCRLHGLGP